MMFLFFIKTNSCASISLGYHSVVPVTWLLERKLQEFMNDENCINITVFFEIEYIVFN